MKVTIPILFCVLVSACSQAEIPSREEGWYPLPTISPSYLYLPERADGFYWAMRYEYRFQTSSDEAFDRYFDSLRTEFEIPRPPRGTYPVQIIEKVEYDCGSEMASGVEVSRTYVDSSNVEQPRPRIEQDEATFEGRWGAPGTFYGELGRAVCGADLRAIAPIPLQEIEQQAGSALVAMFRNGEPWAPNEPLMPAARYRALGEGNFYLLKRNDDSVYMISPWVRPVSDEYAWSYAREEIVRFECVGVRYIEVIRARNRDFSMSHPQAWTPTQEGEPVELEDARLEPPPESFADRFLDGLCESSDPNEQTVSYANALRVGLARAWSDAGYEEPVPGQRTEAN